MNALTLEVVQTTKVNEVDKFFYVLVFVLRLLFVFEFYLSMLLTITDCNRITCKLRPDTYDERKTLIC